MSSTPLLQKPREERKALNGKKSQGARCFLDAADLDLVIDSVSGISPWAVLKSEPVHLAMISELDFVIDEIKAASSQWASTDTEARQIAILSKLETTLSVSRRDPAKYLLMLADEIEMVFPVVTTQADMEWFVDRFRSLLETEFEGMNVNMWCKCKLLPNDKESQKHAKTYEAKLKEFQGWIGHQVGWDAFGVYEKYGAVDGNWQLDWSVDGNWQLDLPTMGECFRKGIEKMVTAGNFECLSRLQAHFEMRTRGAIHKKAALKWSAVGPALRDAMQECDLPEHAFNSTPFNKAHLEQIRDSVLPQFQFRLYRLRGLLEGQVKTVDSFKAKVLAGMVSAAVAGGQLATTYLTHMLQDKQ